MQLPRSITDNLRLLTAEVASQVATLHGYLEDASIVRAQRIFDRAGYAANLKRRIDDGCLRHCGEVAQPHRDPGMLRQAQQIAAELDRIGALCRDCIAQVGQMRGRLDPEPYASLLERVVDAIGLVDRALADRDTHLALRIGRVERRLDKAYRRLVAAYSKQLQAKGGGKDRADLVPALFVARSVEQMGDALLAVSEAIISANLGQPFETGRYRSLKAVVEQFQPRRSVADLAVEQVAETRSGSGISAVSADQQRLGIFKDGIKRKVEEERVGVQNWHELYPGVAPRILSYHKRGKSAALLIEHLAGLTFEQILLYEPRSLLKEALGQLGATLTSVWKQTRTAKPVAAGFMAQLTSRLDEVYGLHPGFRQPSCRVGRSAELAAVETLIERAAQVEKRLPAPFSVYIHGDFNLDNIIYDPHERRINFVDLHRSRYMDYVQDVSVFMVSNYRLQVLDRTRRRRAMALTLAFYRFAAGYARKRGDPGFELRLALGLARSFATSTRFILDPCLARSMFLRSRYLLERVVAADLDRPKRFRIPMEDLFVG